MPIPKVIPLFVEHLTEGDVSGIQALGHDEYTETIDKVDDVPSLALAVILTPHSVQAEPPDYEFTAFAVMESTRRLNNLRRKTEYRIYEITWLNRPIQLEHLAPYLTATQYSHLKKALAAKGGVPPGSGEILVRALRNIYPDIDLKISQIFESGDRSIPPEERQQRAEERDALATTFEIVGLDRMLLKGIAIESGRTYLSAATEQLRTATERDLLGIEMRRFDGLPASDGPTPNSTVFHHPQIGELTVVNVDTKKFETASGVDLIYYRHETRSFVLIQYKRMKKVKNGWRYTSDSKFREQLATMHTITGDLADDDPWNFRIAPNPCYFKLVRGVDYVPHAIDLLPGLYLPMELVETLLRSSQYTTKSGNLSVGLDSSRSRSREKTFQPPYLSNTEFTTLLRGGWTGSRGTTTQKIFDIIARQGDQGRLLMLALHRGGPPPVRARWQQSTTRRRR